MPSNWDAYVNIRYGPSKLDYRQSQNVQDIEQSHKVYRGNHEKLKGGTNIRGKT